MHKLTWEHFEALPVATDQQCFQVLGYGFGNFRILLEVFRADASLIPSDPRIGVQWGAHIFIRDLSGHSLWVWEEPELPSWVMHSCFEKAKEISGIEFNGAVQERTSIRLTSS